MNKIPHNRKLSDEECQLLADIFRLIPREINSKEDVERLAPGELGINYRNGEIVIKNPHNGKPFYPNSVEKLRALSRHFIRGTDMFNADRVKNISFYLDLIELDHLDIPYTPDTVIRQMHAPAVIFAPVHYENFENLGWPAMDGQVFCMKNHEDHIKIWYYADQTDITYEGVYNEKKHFFEGWRMTGGAYDDYFAEADKGGDHPEIRIPTDLEDLMSVIVRVNETIYPDADLKVNNYDPKPIIDQSGNPLRHEIVENTTIMLIYDERKDSWVVLDTTESAIVALMKISLERVNDVIKNSEDQLDRVDKEFNEKLTELDKRVNGVIEELQKKHSEDMKKMQETYTLMLEQISERFDTLQTNMELRFDTMQKSYETMIGNMKAEYDALINELFTRPGNIVPKVSYYTAETDDVGEITTIADFDSSVDKLVVDYGQTVLRAGMDYTIQNNGIRLTQFKLVTGDILQFIVFKQDPAKEV